MASGIKWFLFVTLGCVAGLFLGDLLVQNLPPGAVHDLFAYAVTVGIDPPATLNLKFLALTGGAQFRMTLTGLLGLVLALWAGRRF